MTTTIPDAHAMKLSDTARYYLVGRVPVRLEERPGGGLTVMAFNPLLGGYVSDARYYNTILRHEGDEDGVYPIDAAEFTRRIEELRQEFYPLAAFPR
jgi:hypothetical protein